ncbi:hypothetical protein IJO12_02625 [bacterium]|nr:hypothetical protein [bacterium]
MPGSNSINNMQNTNAIENGFVRKDENGTTTNSQKTVPMVSGEVQTNTQSTKFQFPQELNYEKFPKDKRGEAMRETQATFERISEIVFEHNTKCWKHPGYQIGPDFINGFSRPESFDHKNTGTTKEDMFHLYLESLENWEDNVKTLSKELEKLYEEFEADNIGKKMSDFESKMDSGYFKDYLKYINENDIKKTFEKCNYNLDTTLIMLNQKINDINANKLSKEVNSATEGLRSTVKEEGETTRHSVEEAKDDVQDSITKQAVADQQAMKQNADRVVKDVNKNTDQEAELNALSSAISNAVRSGNIRKGVLSLGGRRTATITAVEDLAREIVGSDSLNHQQKVEKLTLLRELCDKDTIITERDLDSIRE